MNHVYSSKKIVQIQAHVTKITAFNDKLTQLVFSRDTDAFEELFDDFAYCRDAKTKRGKKIRSTYRLAHVEGFTDKTPLNEFDRAVFDAAISARMSGFDSVTADILFRTMTGGRDNNSRASPAMKAAIRTSIERLSKTTLEVDVSELCKRTKYQFDSSALEGAILPCRIVRAAFNGKDVESFEFTGESPLMTIATTKGHILNYDVERLHVPNQRATPIIIAAKSYVVRRVHAVIAHKQTPPTITFADLLAKIRLSDITRRRMQDVRKIVVDVFERLNELGAIDGYQLRRITGGEFDAVTFKRPAENVCQKSREAGAPLRQKKEKSRSSEGK